MVCPFVILLVQHLKVVPAWGWQPVKNNMSVTNGIKEYFFLACQQTVSREQLHPRKNLILRVSRTGIAKKTQMLAAR